jgi:hypothetical protein
MKQLLVAAALLLAAPAFAQQTPQTAISSTMATFDTTWDATAKTAIGNKFDLIAKKWPAEWTTNYYAAYSKVQLSYNEKDPKRKDLLLDDADAYAGEAAKLIGKESDEIYVLRAMIANARMGVDPQNRWQQYGKTFEENLDKAKALNADNPRIYLLRGIAKFYTPKMFGGGKKAALPYFEKADPLFAKESKNDVAKPYWGSRTNGWFMAQAKGEDKDDK